MTYQQISNSTPSSNNDPRDTPDVPAAQSQTHDGSQYPAGHLSATQSPYRPAIRRPLRYSMAMQFAAARAAAAQPRLLAVTSNVVTWREVIFSTRGIT
ncbi:hypothetical protein [Achromobacter insuavis]|uniref:hypothetical protein n=1 Tax=Achromobacter insuavis TaxID=1287735 RepID=UPI0013C32B28|nr:hypothetical protein [Achromobacter insuavis]